jgi:Rho termination factor, N-terminal domain
LEATRADQALTAKEIKQMTTAKMKAIAPDYGIKNSSRMSKDQLQAELLRRSASKPSRQSKP